MPYLKKLKIKGQEYWYLFHTVRDKDKFHKISKYIGKDLPKDIEKLKQDFLEEIHKPKIKDKDTKLLESLTPLERKVLPILKTIKNLDKIAEKTNLKQIEVMRALQWLQNKELLNIKTTEKEVFTLDKNGKEVLENGLPEKRFLKLLPTTMDKIREALTQDEFNVSIGKLKQLDAIKLGKQIEITDKGKEILKDNKLENILKSLPQDIIEDQDLIKRSLIKKEIKKIRTIELTKLGKEISEKKLKTNLIESLTPEMLSKRLFKNKTFRRYDIQSGVPKIYPGKRHFVNEAIDYMKKIWLDMGFKEMTGNVIQTEFWTFDALFQPQDHPARDMQDTFYLGDKGELPDIYKEIKKVHENGSNTGSLGWQYKWDPEIAKKLILRTHTTVLSAQYLAKTKKFPKKYFSIGKVYRNEALDWSHLFEFNQVEGIVIDENVTFKHLLGYLTQFFKKMGYEKIRIRPAYFPYTEPSVEIDVFHPIKEKWIELGGAGIFRPEVTKPLLGKEVPVLAWGLGLGRIITEYYQIKDLRDLYKNDLKKLREAKLFLK